MTIAAVCRWLMQRVGQQSGCQKGDAVAIPISSQVLSGGRFRGADTRSYSGITSSAYLAAWCSGQRRSLHERSYRTLDPVSTGMGDHLWAGIPSRCVTSQLG